MTVINIKNPVEYSFQQWIRGFPESFHPCDEIRFFQFVKNVCKYHATKWKDARFLENEILKMKPECSAEWLQETLVLYENLINFWETPSQPLFFIEKQAKKMPQHSIIERSYKKGKFYEKVIQFNG